MNEYSSKKAQRFKQQDFFSPKKSLSTISTRELSMTMLSRGCCFLNKKEEKEVLKSRMWQGNKYGCLGARHLQQACFKERWEFPGEAPEAQGTLSRKSILGCCRGLPAIPMISFYARSLCSYSWEKSWETEQSCPLSATLEVQKILFRALSAAARQEVRAVTCPGSKLAVAGICFFLLATSFSMQTN